MNTGFLKPLDHPTLNDHTLGDPVINLTTMWASDIVVIAVGLTKDCHCNLLSIFIITQKSSLT